MSGYNPFVRRKRLGAELHSKVGDGELLVVAHRDFESMLAVLRR